MDANHRTFGSEPLRQNSGDAMGLPPVSRLQADWANLTLATPKNDSPAEIIQRINFRLQLQSGGIAFQAIIPWWVVGWWVVVVRVEGLGAGVWR